MKLKNIELKSNFEKMTEDQRNDFKYLSNFIMDCVGLSLNVKKLQIKEDQLLGCWGGLKCKQYPQELAKFLVFINQNKDKITSYFEIGVERGGTFFVVDSWLRAINPNMGISLGIDISDKIVKKHGFEQYHAKNPNCFFLKMSSAQIISDNTPIDLPNNKVNLCLIDGDHSYEAVKKDFEMMVGKADFICMHDIKCPFLDVKKVWDEVGRNGQEFLNEDPRFPTPLGIGVVDANR